MHALDHRDWIMEAEHYANDVYGVTLDNLNFQFDDGSVLMESPSHWVDEAVKSLKGVTQ